VGYVSPALAFPYTFRILTFPLIGNLIASAEKSMTRSRTAYAIEVIDATPRLTDNGRELLLSACQMLQSLIGQEGRGMDPGGCCVVWYVTRCRSVLPFFRISLTSARTNAGRGLAALFVTSPDHELSRPESLYLQTVQELMLVFACSRSPSET
jgi:hypothetical protein